jgi:hypothetical protein
VLIEKSKMKTILIVAMVLIAFPVNAQQQQQQQQQQQRLRELDRKYEEAVYLCGRIFGQPGSKERWSAVTDGFNLTKCIQKQLGL